MKLRFLTILFALLFTISAYGQNIVYMADPGNPWNAPSNPTNLNAAFGSGTWVKKIYSATPASTVFNATTRFVYMEGGENHDIAMNNYLNANRALIESWVTAGGALFLNSAGWNLGMNYGFGGITLYYGTYSGQAIAVTPAHPIFLGPKLPVVTSYSGTYAAHDWVSGPGLVPIIKGGSGQTILAEKNWGAGKVLFGGLTAPYFWSPSSANNLWQNIFLYAYNSASVNHPPSVSISVPSSAPEGSLVTATATVTDPDTGDTASLAWTVTKDGSPYASGSGNSISFTPDDNGSYVVSVVVTDGSGATGSDSETVAVSNVAPTAAITSAPSTSTEGTAINLGSNVTDPGSADTFTYAWSVTKDGNPYASGSSNAFGFTPDDNGTYVVSLTVTDDDGGSGSNNATVTVTNVAPTATITGAPLSSPEGTAIALASTVTDPGTADTFTYAWSVTKDGSPYASGSSNAFSFTPDDNGTYVVSLAATDDDGDTGSDSETVTVTNVAPTATITGAPLSSPEGTAIALGSTVSDPGTADIFTYAWSVTKNGIPYASGTSASFGFTPDDNGVYVATLTVTDDDDGAGSSSATITVTNVAPSITGVLQSAASILENGSLTLTVSFSDPGTADTHSAVINWGDGSTDSVAPASSPFTISHQYLDDNPSGTPSDNYSLSISVSDDDAGSASASGSVDVANVAPVIASLAGPTGPIAINTSATVTASYSDAGSLDTHSCTFDWDNGSTSTSTGSAGQCSATFVYTAAGVYGVLVTVTDDDTGSVQQRFQYVVVYDPNAGFVTGGGWINSPAGAYVADPTLTGTASFGFVSKYQKGASIPTGQTQFQFQAGSLSFHSSTYYWLVVSGAKAQYKGTGTINGAGSYDFLLTATDGQATGGGGVDKFRIKIWSHDSGALVYDNVNGASDDIDAANPQALGGGSIVVHTKR